MFFFCFFFRNIKNCKFSFGYLVKPSSSGTAGACGFFKLFVCSLGKVSSCVGGGGGDKGAKVGVGFSSIGGNGGGGVPITEMK